MKKIIYFFGVIFLSIIILLNIIYTATLDSSEHITITFNSLIYIGLVEFQHNYDLAKILLDYLCKMFVLN